MKRANVAADHPDNAGVLRFIEAGGGGGLHPDVRDHLAGLAAEVDGVGLTTARGVRLLVHRATGVIVGCGLGTTYCLRAAGVPRGAGVRWSVAWMDADRLNLRKAFGPGWIVGGFRPDETAWLRAATAALVPGA